MHLARGLEADPPRGAGHQRDLSVQVVDGHRGATALRRLLESLRAACPAFAPSTPSSPSPSSRSGCSSAGASATSSTARSPTARAPRSGASTRARRPPTAGPAPTTSSPASSRTSTRATGRCAATGCRARRAGTATACRSSSRSKRSSGSPPSRRSRSTGSPSSTQRCRESVFEYVEEWNRLTERIGFWIDLDDPYVTLEDDYIESVWWSLRKLWDDEPPLRGPQGRALLPALRHRALLARGGARLQGRQGPLHLRALPAARRRTASESGESLLVWTTTPWTLPGNEAVAVAPRSTYVGEVDGEDPDPRRAAWSRGARRGAPRSSTASRARPGRPSLPRPVFELDRPRAAAASRPRRRLRHHRGRHRPRPHRAGLRRGRLRGRRRGRDLRPHRRTAASTTPFSSTAPSTGGSPASRASSSRTPRSPRR